jgi:divalent metal cation (Fe/Co/Zn/Cd) transporter
VRSRRSGRVVFIELALRFEPALPIGEIDRRIQSLRQSIGREIENSDVAILALPGHS